MAQIIVPSRRVWTRQPQQYAPIDPEFGRGAFLLHSFAQPPGLSDASGFSSRSAPGFSNPAGYQMHAYFVDQIPGLAQTPIGMASSFDGSLQRLYTSGRSGLASGVSPDESFVVAFIPKATTGIQALTGYFSDNANTPTNYGRGIWIDSGVIKASGVSATSGRILSSGITVTPGVPYVVGVRCSTNGALFVNGAKMAAGSLDQSWTYNLAIASGGGTNNPIYKFSGYVAFAYGVQRGLTNGQLADLTANPWSIFRPRRRIAYFDLGGGSTLNAAASGTAQSTGTANLAAQVALAAVGVSTAAGTASTAVSIPLAAAGIAVSDGTANAQATVTISAAGLATAAGAAGLSASVLLQAAGAAEAAGNAALAAQLNALAAGAAEASGSANLTGGAPGELSAAGQAVSSGSAVLSVTVQLQATGAAEVSGTASGQANAPGGISASGGAEASGSAIPSVTATITAAGFVQAMGQGSLTVQVNLAALGAAIAAGTATLSQPGAGMTANARFLVIATRRQLAVRAAPRNYTTQRRQTS